jgi:hypothetical protein
MAARSGSRTYQREDVEEFDRKLRRFSESLAHKERRMLREIITAALEEEEMDVAAFVNADDDTVFQALFNYLMSMTTSEV